jgi:transcriptional regulator with XRE-family HTH domain
MAQPAPCGTLSNSGGIVKQAVQKATNPIDKHVGGRVRMRRMMLGMSQSTLGDGLGRVQKYEKGTNRMGASRLQHISHILQVPVPFFFEGAPHLPGQSEGDGAAPSPTYHSRRFGLSAFGGFCSKTLCCAADAQSSNPRSRHLESEICALWLILESILRVGSLENSFATQSRALRT